MGNCVTFLFLIHLDVLLEIVVPLKYFISYFRSHSKPCRKFGYENTVLIYSNLQQLTMDIASAPNPATGTLNSRNEIIIRVCPDMKINMSYVVVFQYQCGIRLVRGITG